MQTCDVWHATCMHDMVFEIDNFDHYLGLDIFIPLLGRDIDYL